MAYLAYSAPAPIEHPAVTRARLYRNVSVLVDRLIGILDDLDGPGIDLEDGGDDEPGLGWPSNPLIDQTYWIALATSDDDRETDDEDEEPSLCGVDFGGGSFRDAEWECEDEGTWDGNGDIALPETGMGPQ